MNYKWIYDSLISKAVDRAWSKSTAPCYIEIHHIIPKCLSGTNHKKNLVSLTASEHFVAHQLLAKIYPDNIKLAYALNSLSRKSSGQIRNNKQYAWIKNKLSKIRSDNWKGDLNPGKYKTDETKMKISLSGKGNTNAKGSKRTLEQNKYNSERQAKTHYMIDPIGNSITIIGMRSYCLKNSLNVSHMCSVSAGREKQYKGWTKQSMELQ